MYFYKQLGSFINFETGKNAMSFSRIFNKSCIGWLSIRATAKGLHVAVYIFILGIPIWCSQAIPTLKSEKTSSYSIAGIGREGFRIVG